MDLQLSGKRVLVTGSTAGIGWATARLMAAEGAEVVINGRTTERVGAAVARIRDSVTGTKVQGIAADLSDAKGVALLIAGAGDVDVLVNNMGIFEPKPFEEIEDEAWFRFFETNVMSGVRLARHYLPKMKAVNSGRIIFVSSESGICPPAEMVHYGMSKSAQLSVSRGLAETCAGTAVTVNAVLPGPTRTEGVGEFFAKLARDQGISLEEMERKLFSEARPTSIIRRFIDPEEVAGAVAYLCSGRAGATNGAAFRVDGGIVRAIM